MPRSTSRFDRLAWMARWKLSAAFNRGRFRPYPLGGAFIYLNINESLMMYQCARGAYDRAKQDVLRSTLKPGACFVDAGANMGYFALLAAGLVGERGRVLAVEPAPDNRAWLTRSIEHSALPQVEVVPVALSDTAGEATLHLGEKSGWHTLNPGQRRRESGALDVPMQTLDTLAAGVGKVDCIKTDVEGHEYEVLAGARETLRRDRPVILLDTHPQLGARLEDLESLLRELDYRWAPVAQPRDAMAHLPGEPADLILSPRESPFHP